MIFYVATNPDGTRQLCTTQAEARAIDKEFQALDIHTDKPGLRDAIQELLSIIDGQALSVEPEAQESNPAPVSAQPEAQKDPVLSTREQFMDAWDSFPLALKLHYAAMATEDARSAIKPVTGEPA
jgi:hypothetical protein